MSVCDRLKCEVVRDLLPNYIEGLTSAETNGAVHKHMEACDECKKLHDKLKTDMAVPKVEKKDLLRLLRAIRKARITQMILAVLGGIILTWTVIFVMSSGFSVVSPGEIQVQNIYRLSDGSMVVAYKVPGLDSGMLAGVSGRQYGNGDYDFEITTSFWNRLFGRSRPEREIFYELVHSARSIDLRGNLYQEDEPLIISYGYGKDSRELWRKSDPVEIATPEFEIYISRGIRQKYEDFLEDYLWRQSVTSPSPTPDPEGSSGKAEPIQ